MDLVGGKKGQTNRARLGIPCVKEILVNGLPRHKTTGSGADADLRPLEKE